MYLLSAIYVFVGLAYQIIYWYLELIKFYKEKGLKALHFLSQNPLAFRNGCDLGPFDDFIYRCDLSLSLSLSLSLWVEWVSINMYKASSTRTWPIYWLSCKCLLKLINVQVESVINPYSINKTQAHSIKLVELMQMMCYWANQLPLMHFILHILL